MAGMPIWYELMVPDPAAVAQFYGATLGWEIPAMGNPMPNGSEYREIARQDGGMEGGVLTLTPEMTAGGAMPGWIIYFHVEDVEAAIAATTAAGGKLWMDQTTPGIGRMAMLSDPQGAAFYAMNPTPPADRPDAVSDVFKFDTPGHCAWNELATDDAPGQIDFYTALFGWQVIGEMPMPGEHIYKFLEAEGVGIGAIGSMKADGARNAWMPYFRVADIAAAIESVPANGGTILNGPHDVPGGDRIIIARDPAGAAVGLVGKAG